MNRKQKGFSMIEVLLSVAIIGILVGTSVPVYQVFYNKNIMDVASVSVAQSLRRAQILSQSVDGDMSWGVSVGSNKITVFKGVDYVSRAGNLDEDFDLPESVTPSGLSEVVFNKLTGEPQSTGTLTLTSSNGEVRTITINEKGIIEY
jgi:prepilin-type N-terminal cleavage/methylation domain-containing protein